MCVEKSEKKINRTPFERVSRARVNVYEWLSVCVYVCCLIKATDAASSAFPEFVCSSTSKLCAKGGSEPSKITIMIGVTRGFEVTFGKLRSAQSMI